jgi:hypothetical protein
MLRINSQSFRQKSIFHPFTNSFLIFHRPSSSNPNPTSSETSSQPSETTKDSNSNKQPNSTLSPKNDFDIPNVNRQFGVARIPVAESQHNRFIGQFKSEEMMKEEKKAM